MENPNNRNIETDQKGSREPDERNQQKNIRQEDGRTPSVNESL